MKAMASRLSFLIKLLPFALVLAVFSATSVLGESQWGFDVPLGDVPVNYTHICNQTRFSDMYGLDMTDFVFCDSSLPYEVRAKDLVGRMTLAEKVQQMGSQSMGVKRLGIPSYQWWSEALHGIADTGPGVRFDNVTPGATSFPAVILTAASFNQSLWKHIGQTVSTEARALFNLGKAGLTYWSPNLNVIRDPRWGRTMETPGEDPLVVGTYGVNYVRGLQDVEGTENFTDLNSRPLKTSCCCKHYVAYDLDNWYGIDRFHFDARVTEQDMVETFQRPFEMCVREGDASSAMCSFNRINGVPVCHDRRLLKDTIRGQWNLHGYIVADCDSVQVISSTQNWLDESADNASAKALQAGLDLDCGKTYNETLQSSVGKGAVREADIDRSLVQLYVVLMRLGYFDGSPQFKSLGQKDICAEEHMNLAAQAAREGIVLLKNDNKTLPLSSDEFKKLAVIGPHANSMKKMLGIYAGPACRFVTPAEGFSAYGEVVAQMGCPDIACSNDSMFEPALITASQADATILLMGLDDDMEREGFDRTDFLLPGNQTDLVNQIAENATGPVILVVLSGSNLDLSFAQNNPKIQAILWAGYPGQEGGRAIADVVFGNHNPGGRLPLTWYVADYVNRLPLTSMKLRPDKEFGYPGRTYKFYDGPVVYPFGYGLSYTHFNYKLASKNDMLDIKLTPTQHCCHVNYTDDQTIKKPSCPAVLVDDLKCDEISEIAFQVEVQNVGEMHGDEVVIVYSKPPKEIAGAPKKQVIGFQRVSVPAGGSKTVKFSFSLCKSFNIIDGTGYNLVPAGTHTIMLGDSGVSFPVQINHFH